MTDGIDRTDLGHGVSYSWVSNQSGKRIGIIEWHVCQDPDGELSGGGVYFEMPGDGPRWQLESQDPLTISPSVLCVRCGLHGFIKDGRWLPA